MPDDEHRQFGELATVESFVCLNLGIMVMAAISPSAVLIPQVFVLSASAALVRP